jgi:methionyl-tRNA formyltransferase
MTVKICFYGNNTDYSNQVKTALEKAGYQLSFSCCDRNTNLIISAAYGRKITADELAAAKYGGLNLHPSLLPAYRGPAPVPQQILDGVTESGISIIKMTDKFDAGPIVSQEKVAVLPQDTSQDLLNRCFLAGAKLLIKILPRYLSTKITLKIQDETQATYTRKFTKADGYISWEEFKIGVPERKIRALFPWPGVWTKMPNGKILKILPFNRLQIEGKQPITYQQFKAGYL